MEVCMFRPLTRFETPMKANGEENNERRRLVEQTEAHILV